VHTEQYQGCFDRFAQQQQANIGKEGKAAGQEVMGSTPCCFDTGQYCTGGSTEV
jgi:hypothetical protein